MDDYKHLCPVCKINGKTSFLQLRQINFTTATYLCKDIRCTYPQGYSWMFMDRDTFTKDECDSDSSNISDEVNDDIERMLMTTHNSNGTNVAKYLNNNYTSDKVMDFNVKAEGDIIYDRDEHNMGDCKIYSTSQQSRRTEKVSDLFKTTKNFKGASISKYLNNSHMSEKININTETDIYDRDRHSLACDKHSTSEQLAITEDTCDDVIILDSVTEVNNVIEVPDELFTSLDLPSTSNTTNLQPTILASGAPNSEIVNVDALKDIKSVATDIQYHLVKNDKEPNKFNIDIDIIVPQKDINKLNVIKTGGDNADVQYTLAKSNKEPDKSEIDTEMLDQKKNVNELNNSICTDADVHCSLATSDEESNKMKLDHKNNNNSINSPNKKKDLKTGKLSKLNGKQGTSLNLMKAKNINKVNVIKVPFDVSKVINVSKNINSEQNIVSKSNEISNSEEKNEKIILVNPRTIDLENILSEDNPKDNIIEMDYKSNNAKEIKIKKVTARSKNNSLDLILPFVEDVNPELELIKPKQKLETVFQSKLKIQSKKSKQSSFCFSESILEEALKTAKDSKETEPPKNRSLISMLFEPNNSDINNKNSASAFKGFKFSSEVIKPANPELPKKKGVKESPSKCLVENFQRSKEKKFNKKLRDKNIEQVQFKSETVPVNNDSNTSASSKSEIKDSTNLGLGDMTLNELFDNIDGLGTVNVPNNSVDIAEVDDWLTSLCQ